MRHSQQDNPNAYRGQTAEEYRYQQRQPTQQGYQQTGGQYQQTGGQGYPQGQQGYQPVQQSSPSPYAQPAQSQQQPQQYAQSAPQAQQPGQTGAQQVPGAQQRAPGTQQASTGAAQRPQLRSVSIEEVVTTDVVTAERSTPVRTVVGQMAERNVGSVVIVEDTTPVGILTDREIALALESTPDVADRRADELLSGDLVTGTSEMSVFDVLRQLSETEIRRLPIVSEDGNLQGIVTLDDIFRLLSAELANATEIIERQSP